jgi:hypothetical protein
LRQISSPARLRDLCFGCEGRRRVLNFASSVTCITTGGILFESAEAARDLFCGGRRPVLTIANLVRLRYFTEDLG